jgi:hypothetical protein
MEELVAATACARSNIGDHDVLIPEVEAVEFHPTGQRERRGRLEFGVIGAPGEVVAAVEHGRVIAAGRLRRVGRPGRAVVDRQAVAIARRVVVGGPAVLVELPLADIGGRYPRRPDACR